MRWFFDTEFNEDGRTIELISLGLVNEDGTEQYHAVSSEFDPDACSDWVKLNVLTKLPDKTTWKPRSVIANEIQGLVLGGLGQHKPEFWAYFADYDWVALCQLYGRMIDLPKGFPMYCMDLKQLMKMMGFDRSDLPVQDAAGVHNALEDAKWARTAWLWIDQRLRVARETVP